MEGEAGGLYIEVYKIRCGVRRVGGENYSCISHNIQNLGRGCHLVKLISWRVVTEKKGWTLHN